MKTAVIICPGRGTYNKSELGYLRRHHPDKADLIALFDHERKATGQETLSELDAATDFSSSKHTRGDNASALIFAATLTDFLSIDLERIEIVAVTGNSMGWYSALTCAGALSPQHGFQVVDTMGRLMQESLIGGQLIYPFVDDDWRDNPQNKAELLALVAEINQRPGHALSLSIDLGGMLVLAGERQGLAAFEAMATPLQGRFPMRLLSHAAFHTALQEPVAKMGRERLGIDLFAQPDLPLIDGRGAIWWPGATDVEMLRDYTLGEQVTKTYDFTRAIRTAACEFAPDLFVITGPGSTLGGAVAQALILSRWKTMASKQEFQALQATEPFLISMGITDQRAGVEETRPFARQN